jgi:hypothetical protein
MSERYTYYDWSTGIEMIDWAIAAFVKSTKGYINNEEKSEARKFLLAGGEQFVPIIVKAIISTCEGNYGFDPFPGYTSREITPLIRILGEIGSPKAVPLLLVLYKIFLKKGYRIGVKQKSNVFDAFFDATLNALRECDKPRRWWEKLLNLRPWAN